VEKNLINHLEKKLGYQFSNPDLLVQAISHRSSGNNHYERLEFLGDSILGFVIAEELYNRFPKASEGQMTRLRSNLVKGKTLAGLARILTIGDFLQLGTGELKSGGFRRDSILADAFEAIVCGIYLDGGMDICRERLLTWYSDLLSEANPEHMTKDPKTLLQEHMQSFNLHLPVYETIAVTGVDHDQQFEVKCSCEGNESNPGTSSTAIGKSRRQAEKSAAKKVLLTLGIMNNDKA